VASEALHMCSRSATTRQPPYLTKVTQPP
jgi:hypothetical protein